MNLLAHFRSRRFLVAALEKRTNQLQLARAAHREALRRERRLLRDIEQLRGRR